MGKTHFLVFLVALSRLVQAGEREKTELYHISTKENLQGAMQWYKHLESTLQIGINTLMVHGNSVA